MKSHEDAYKKGFEAWENLTADLLEKWTKSPLMLKPMAVLLTQAIKARGTQEKMMSAWWTMMGLPTKRDQQRTLFALHKLESRLMDLEERLDEIKPRKGE
jgi:hypothetical protein